MNTRKIYLEVFQQKLLLLGCLLEQGCLTFSKIGKGLKNEVLIKGSVLQECDDAMELLDNLDGFWIHNDLITETLRSSFNVGLNKFDEWFQLIGVKKNLNVRPNSF